MKLDDAFKCRWRLLRQLEAWWFLRNQRTEKRHDFFIRQFNQKQQLGGGIPLFEWLINGLPNYTWDNSSNWGHQRLCISASPPGRRSPQLRHSFAMVNVAGWAVEVSAISAVTGCDQDDGWLGFISATEVSGFIQQFCTNQELSFIIPFNTIYTTELSLHPYLLLGIDCIYKLYTWVCLEIGHQRMVKSSGSRFFSGHSGVTTFSDASKVIIHWSHYIPTIAPLYIIICMFIYCILYIIYYILYIILYIIYYI